MIELKFGMANPWPFSIGEDQPALFLRHWRLSTHKNFEIQLAHWSRKSEFFRIWIDAPLRGRHHAGLNLEIGILGLDLMLNLYDSRHWDYENEVWEKYEN